MSATVNKNIYLYLNPIREAILRLQNKVDNGVVNISTVGNSPNSSGGTVVGDTLQLQPANSTNPGVITALSQTIGGVKTFSGEIKIKDPLSVNTVSLKSPNIASSLSLTLPMTNGAFGQVLSTNGIGMTYWQPLPIPPAPVIGYVNITLFVDQTYGDDLSAVADNPTKPWKTLAAAKAVAHDGYVIYVNPGTYADGNLWARNINWYFSAGTIVDSHDDIFVSTEIGPWTFNVFGYGQFISDKSVVFFDSSADQTVYIQALSMESRGSDTILMGKSNNNYFVNVQKNIVCNSVDPAHSAVYFKGGNIIIKAQEIKNTGQGKAVYSSDDYDGTMLIYCSNIQATNNNVCEFTSAKYTSISITTDTIICNTNNVDASAILVNGDTILNISCQSITSNGSLTNRAISVNQVSGSTVVFCNKISNNGRGTAILCSNGLATIIADEIFGNSLDSTIIVSGGVLKLMVSDTIYGGTTSAITVSGGASIVEIDTFGIIASGIAKAIFLSGAITRFNIRTFKITTSGGVALDAAVGFTGTVNLTAQTISALGRPAINIAGGTHYISVQGSVTSNTTSVINISAGTVALNIFAIFTIIGTIQGLSISGGTVSGGVDLFQCTGNSINISSGTTILSNSSCISTTSGTISISGGTNTLYLKYVSAPANTTAITNSGTANTSINMDSLISSAANVFGVLASGSGTFTIIANIISTTLQAINDQTSGISTFIINNYCSSTTAPPVLIGNGGITYLKITNIQAVAAGSAGILVNTGTVYGAINSITTITNTIPAINVFGGTKVFLIVDAISATGACFKSNANVPTFLSIREGISSNESCISLTNTTAKYTFEGTYRCTYNNASGYGISVTGPAIPILIVKNAVFVTTATPANSITSNIAATPLRVYGHAMSNLALSANISLLCGIYEVSASVV
jgi:hypothetical protein